MFSEVVKKAALQPQIITVRGKETAALLSIEEYKKLAAPKQTLYEFMRNSPLRDLKLKLPERLPEKKRATGL